MLFEVEREQRGQDAAAFELACKREVSWMRELMEMWKMRFEDVLTYLHFRSPVAALQVLRCATSF